MGQAALDLPDPLQSPPPQAPQTSTDDLLAQLAGDEIDRLLSEVDGGAPRAVAAPFHVAPPTKPETEPTHIAAAEPAAEPAPAPEPSFVEQEVTAELDALFTAAAEKDKALDAAAATASEQTSAAERAGLATPEAPAADVDDALPWYLRPLEWLNAPLMIFPPGVRDLIGKAAIVTLLNATAILIYVLIVRGW